MSAGAESPSDQLADAATAQPGGGDAAGPGQVADVDAADAAGVGDIGWATDPPGEFDGGNESATHGAPAHGAPADDGSENPGQGSPGQAGTSPADGSAGVDPASADAGSISAEDLVQDLERVTAERDQYLDASRRLQAEFENYRKAVAKREVEARERANESLIAELLPVLDACDGALASGATDVEPVRASLLDTLTKQGLTRIDDLEAPFDPERHEAVMHEPDEDGAGPVVAEVMRAGYLWKGRVVRPAMVRVRG